MIKKLNFNFLYLGSFITIVILSWLRYGMSNQLKVDDVVLNSPIGISSSIIFVGGIIVHFYSFFRMNLEQFNWHRYAHIINIISFFMLPCISNDIFSLLGYGETFDYSSSVFSKPINSDSYLYPYISQLYTETPNVYGIGSLILAKISIDQTSVLASIFQFKLICFLLVTLTLILINKIENIESKNKAFFLLNPLWTIQALGQSHTEVISVCILIISIFFIYKNQYLISAFIFGLGVLAKLSILICLPILFFYRLGKNKFELNNITKFLLVYLLIGVAFLVWIQMSFGNLDILTRPLNTLNAMWPTGSFSAYIFDLFFKQYVTPDLISNLVLVFKFVFFGYVIALVSRYRNEWSIKYNLVLYYVMIGFLNLYSHRLLTWYLILVLPIFILIKSRSMRRDFMILACAMTCQDAAHYNHNHFFNFGVLILGIGVTIILQVKILIHPFKNLFSKNK